MHAVAIMAWLVALKVRRDKHHGMAGRNGIDALARRRAANQSAVHAYAWTAQNVRRYCVGEVR